MASKEKTPPDDKEIEEGEVLDLRLDTDMSLGERRGGGCPNTTRFARTALS